MTDTVYMPINFLAKMPKINKKRVRAAITMLRMEIIFAIWKTDSSQNTAFSLSFGFTRKVFETVGAVEKLGSLDFDGSS